MFSVAHVHRWSSRWMGLFLWILGLAASQWWNSLWMGEFHLDRFPGKIVSHEQCEKRLLVDYEKRDYHNIHIGDHWGWYGVMYVRCCCLIVIWCYMVLYGVIWCYMVLYRVIRCYMVLYGVILSNIYIYIHIYIYIYIYMIPSSAHEVPPPSPPNGMGPQVAPPLPFYLQAIGSISEVQLRIC